MCTMAPGARRKLAYGGKRGSGQERAPKRGSDGERVPERSDVSPDPVTVTISSATSGTASVTASGGDSAVSAGGKKRSRSEQKPSTSGSVARWHGRAQRGVAAGGKQLVFYCFIFLLFVSFCKTCIHDLYTYTHTNTLASPPLPTHKHTYTS